MGLINWLINLLRKEQTIPIIHGKEVTSKEVIELLTPFTDRQWISDGVFECIITSNLRTFLINDRVSKRIYKQESFDCDDYSYSLMGNITQWYPEGSIGIIWGLNKYGEPHAWNFFINEDKQIMFIEPQNDMIFSPTTERTWVMII